MIPPGEQGGDGARLAAAMGARDLALAELAGGALGAAVLRTRPFSGTAQVAFVP